MKKHKVNKTIQEINAKIQSGNVVVVTAEEIIDIVKDEGPVEAARKTVVGAHVNGGISIRSNGHCFCTARSAECSMRTW